MKKALALTAALGLLSLSTTAHAQEFFGGQMGPLGPSSKSGLEMVGAYVGLASSTVGATGQLRFGIGSDKWDVGVEGGFAHFSVSGADVSSNSVGAAVDLKGALAELSGNKEVKLGGDIAAGFSHASGTTALTVSAIPGISIQHPMSGGASISGWGGIGISWTHVPSQDVTIGGVTESVGGGSASSAALRLGGGYGFSKDMTVVAEFNHSFASGGGDAFMGGINFGLGGK